jgi:hypothetical protein
MSFSRYRVFVVNGKIISIPSISIKNRETDRYVVYNYQRNRLDRIAGDIYNDETYWWVIMMANPNYYLEYDIPNETVIRVPFPLDEVLYDFQKSALSKISNLNL